MSMPAKDLQRNYHMDYFLKYSSSIAIYGFYDDRNLILKMLRNVVSKAKGFQLQIFSLVPNFRPHFKGASFQHLNLNEIKWG